jgi:hypothetical protein
VWRASDRQAAREETSSVAVSVYLDASLSVSPLPPLSLSSCGPPVWHSLGIHMPRCRLTSFIVTNNNGTLPASGRVSRLGKRSES